MRQLRSHDGCDDLEVRKTYQVVPDEDAISKGLIRVIDESGEDYLFPKEYFVPIELSSPIRTQLSKPV